MEIWKPLVYPNLPYEKNRFLISSYGRLMNKNSGLIYRPELLRTGYYSVRIGLSHSERMHIILHKAVAYTFIENPNHLKFVNHKDGNKQNNNVSNLEWCTASDNTQHAYANKLIDVSKISGENNSSSKLSEQDVIIIRATYQKGSSTSGERALARKYHVSRPTINNIINNRSWKNTADCA